MYVQSVISKGVTDMARAVYLAHQSVRRDKFNRSIRHISALPPFFESQPFLARFEGLGCKMITPFSLMSPRLCLGLIATRRQKT